MQRLDVDEMLSEIPYEKFQEWREYERLEMFPDEQNDWNFAHVVQTLARDDRPLREFLLPFGDRPSQKVKQSLEMQERMLDAWISGSNAIFAAQRPN